MKAREVASDDPEVFSAYRTLAAGAESITTAHVNELVALVASVIRDGVKEGSFRKVDSAATGRALLLATLRFHHPAHASGWNAPNIDAEFDDLWRLLMRGLAVSK